MVNQSRLIQTFTDLVAIDSPSFGERAVCDHLKAILRDQLSLNPVEDGAAALLNGNCGNLYTYVDGGLNLPPLLLSAHMDTVEPSCGKKAIVHPDGKITSEQKTVLGADDLAGIAAIIEALRCLKEQNLPHRPLEILFTVAEEPYNVGVHYVDPALLRSKEAYVFDLTGPVGTAAYQAPTMLTFTAVFHGRPAHAGFEPEKGIHAIKAAAHAIDRIPCGRVDGATVNIGTIEGGRAGNIIPEFCRLKGEIRSHDHQRALDALAQIKAQLEASAAVFRAEVSVTEELHCIAYQTPLDHPVVSRFKAACQCLELTPQLVTTFGGSDNNQLSQYGLRGLVVANAMQDCHSLQEYTTVSDLTKATELALALILAAE